MATQNQDRLRTHFSSLETTPTAQGSGWDSLWESASFLPWDRGYVNPALIDLLASPSSPPPTSEEKNPTPGAPSPSSTPPAIELPKPVEAGKRKRVLVPGCGKGYDVALFAAYGYDAYGLEVSQHAARAAESYLSNSGAGSLENEYEGRDGGQGKGRSVCLVGDFFGDDWVKQTGGTQFDIIYDNTVRSQSTTFFGGARRKWKRKRKIANINPSSSALSPPPCVRNGPNASPPSSRPPAHSSASSSPRTNPRPQAVRHGLCRPPCTRSC